MPVNKAEIRRGGYFTVNMRFRLGTRPPEGGDDPQHRPIYDALGSLESFDRGQMLAALRRVPPLRPRGDVDALYCRQQIRSMYNCGYIERA